MPEALSESQTESTTSGAEDELEEIRRMRVAIQRDRRRRLAAGLSIAGVALAIGAFCLRPQIERALGGRKPAPAASALGTTVPRPNPPKAEAPRLEGIASKPAPKLAGPVLAPAPKAPDSEQGFQPLFNGRDLSGWSGDARHWLVKDGMIVGRALPDEPAKTRIYLQCEGGAVEDFELRFSFRCLAYKNNERPNGGVEYRASRVDSTRMKGYQYDIVRDSRDVGAVMDDQGRALLGSQGAQVQAGLDNGKDFLRAVGAATPSNLVATAFQKDDWNEGVIVAQGNRLVHRLNGQVMADVVDQHKQKRHSSGLIALEMYLRNTNNPATFIMFKDIRLKTLKAGGR